MRDSTYDIALYMFSRLPQLCRAGIPIPESLRYFADQCKIPATHNVFVCLANKTVAGIPLSQAMAEYPEIFDPHDVLVVEEAENSGNIAVGLEELGETAYGMATNARSVSEIVMAASSFVTLSGLLMWGLLYLVAPRFAQINDEMLAGEPLPHITEVVFGVAALLYNHDWFAVIVFAVLCLPLAMLCTVRMSRRVTSLVGNLIVRFSCIGRHVDNARFTRVWSTCLQHSMAEEASLHTLDKSFRSSSLAGLLSRWRTRKHGVDTWVERIAEDLDAEPLLTLAVRHTARDRMHDVLGQLSAILQGRTHRFLNLASNWAVFAVLGFALLVYTIMGAFMLPILKLIDLLGG